MTAKPRIAVMLDENTTNGGSMYELSKNYFRAIQSAGGVPYGIPYCADFIELAVKEFDGFFSVGGNVAFPADWYLPGQKSLYVESERIPVEMGIMKSFLTASKPVLGSCNGMQLLAGLHGCRLRSDLGNSHRETMHNVRVMQGTNFAALVGQNELTVNSRHGEAVAEASDRVKVAALSPDGVIEAIEIPGQRFALGMQWHQEEFWNDKHPGNAAFVGFIAACR